MSQCKKLVQKKNLSTEAGNAMENKNLGKRKKKYSCKKGNEELNCVGYPYSFTTEEIGITASLIVIPEKKPCFTFFINVPIQSNVEHRFF